MAVGDVDQCVYEWRGARPEFMIDRFFSDFPDATRYRLSHSFRFGHRLSLLADHAIAHNRPRDDQLCLSAPGTPDTHVDRRVDAPGRHPAAGALRRQPLSIRSAGNTLGPDRRGAGLRPGNGPLRPGAGVGQPLSGSHRLGVAGPGHSCRRKREIPYAHAKIPLKKRHL